MKDPLAVRVTGPLERYAAGFVAELVEAGYRPNSAAVHLRLLAHTDHQTSCSRSSKRSDYADNLDHQPRNLQRFCEMSA